MDWLGLLRMGLNGETMDDEAFTVLGRAKRQSRANGSGTKKTEAWNELFKQVQRQSLEGVIWPVVKDRKLPLDIACQWVNVAEEIRGLNELLNKEAARMTRVFEEAGRKTAILKGQANARLYPDKLSRQPGDIDIWVEGGQESVMALLLSLGLLNERPANANIGKEGKATESYHHVHLPTTKEGITVEVHFRPSSGNFCPWTNRRLQDWLEEEIKTVTRVEEGFNVPSTRFALVMQLSHIQRHFLREGIGMRQICDYYWLLRHSTEEERRAVSGKLGPFGLRRMAGALMWVLREKLHLDAGLMICEPDAWRGEWLLRDVMEGGNFGRYADWQQAGVLRRVLMSQARHLKLMRFDFWEVVWLEISYWTTIVKTAPERVKRGKVSLREG